MFENDYLMRMIHEAVRAILKLLFNIDEPRSDILDYMQTEGDDDSKRIFLLLSRGEINEAENQLYDHLDTSDMKQLHSALYFYDYLNSLDEDYLQEHNYSKDEVKDGLKNVLKMYGVEGIVETLLS